ncbi:MAG: YebC/PmpR family DNA-binding transcriptional regulator [Planctomycetes bacterium]|nr:YebC/PmpR family DNA-binding transcriptional regulator [Planctomycetota bacterium]MCC7397279.1 YebC/PmpR family DNA-binding transcriptional regulator [Planctomycetota bacterium]
MGRQWLHSKRELNANKKAKITSKLVREIMVAAKMGVPDPAMNPRLSLAVEAARKQSVSNDVISRAIKKGSGTGDDAVNYELIAYEGMAPHNVPVIVECMTENRNRTAPDMRSLWKHGQFGSKVTFLFDHLGIVEATHETAGLDLESAAIEAGAQDVRPLASTPADHSGGRFLTERTDLYAVADALRAAGWHVASAELGYAAKDKVVLTDAARTEVEEFLEGFDDHDDVHRIYTGID